MVRLVTAALLASAAFVGFGAAAGFERDCGEDLGPCPAHKPCCSQYGQCGAGAFCLGGCDPRHSFKLESCVPAPVCKSKKHEFNDGTDSVIEKWKYLGDSTKHDWVVDGKVAAHNGNLLLTMAPDSVGTVLSSSVYIWYGKVKATLKTSRGAGVVSAFILMSDMKDEIDYEWVGVDLETIQTNWYYQGIPDYTNGRNISTSDTYNNYHTYEIDWTPDQITWSVDGIVGRVLKKSDTYNETSKRYNFPQTPARAQLSLWPGGLPTNEEGTIQWAGGVIDWNHDEVKKNGYYYVSIKDIEIECYDPPASAKKTGDVSYIYDNALGYEENVVISNKKTVLKSLLGTGTDMDKVSTKKPTPTATAAPSKDDDDKDDDKDDKPEDTVDEDEEVETVPGIVNGGFGSHADGLTGVMPSNPSSSGSSGSGSGSGAAVPEDVDPAAFDQGVDTGAGNSGAAALTISAGAIAAGLVAVFAL